MKNNVCMHQHINTTVCSLLFVKPVSKTITFKHKYFMWPVGNFMF